MKYIIMHPAGKNRIVEFCLFVLLLMSAIPAVFGTCSADNDNNYATGMLTLASSKVIISNGSEPSETHKLPFDLWYRNDYPDGDIIITKEVQVVAGNTVYFYYQIEYTLDPNEEPTSYTIEENGWEKTIYRVSLPCLVNTGRADKGTDDDGHTTYTIEYYLIERTVVDPRLKPPDQSFNITVTLTDKGDGTIAPTELTVRDIEGQKKTYTDEENFNNGIFVGEFKNELRSDSAPFTVPVVKKLEGRAPIVSDKWTFTITAVCEKEGKYVECENKEDKGPLPEPNYVKGTVTGEDPIRFEPVKFTANQLGPCSMTGTGSYTCDPKDFIYKVTETGDVSNVDTDGPKYFTVTVSLNPKGDIQAEVKGTADLKKLLTFTNTYTPEGSLRIRGMKYLSGMDLEKDQFHFVLINKDNGIMDLKSNDESGSFIFPPIKFTKEGTYLYTVKEYGCEDGNGLTCDKTKYVIQAMVSDDVNTGTFKVGTKVFRCPEDRDDEEECIETDLDTTKLEFTNKYQPKGDIQFTGTKTLSGMDLKKDQFSFVLLDKEGNVLQTVTNDAGGSIIFEPIEFTKAGTYLYTVKESGCEDGNGLTCDKTEHKITVTVTDNQDGTLTAEADIDVTKLDFTNEYQAVGDVHFRGNKILDGKDLKEGQFSFVLLDQNGKIIETAKNNADGNFDFDTKLHYTKPGTYTYTIKEYGCENKDGITCDNTEYKITATATDNMDGTLIVRLKADVYRDGTFIETVDLDISGVDFTNEYHAELSIQFGGTITLSGMDLEKGQFSFVLLDEDREVLQTAANEADGSYLFGRINYTEAGTYHYTVKENGCEDKDGLTCDKTAYKITVTVTEDVLTGKLTAQTDTDVSKLNFTNTYKDNKINPMPHAPIRFEHLPETGFPTLHPVTLPVQPKKLSYRLMGWTLLIPTLSLSAEIVEVPADGGNYPVTWLGSATGLLEGSAIPGDGRSILTGHNHLNLTEAGPFSQLWSMDPGDRIFILDPQGELQTFIVTANEKIAEDDVSGLLRITERHPRSMTLITCEDERPNGTYANRRIISAVPH